MKIGMLTFYDVVNYGAVLQAYALQKKIEKFGFSAEFIRVAVTNRENIMQNKLKLYYRVLKNNNFSVKSYLIARNADYKKVELFQIFRERYMSVSRIVYKDLMDLQKKQSAYDAFVTGSDMVWSDIGQNLDIYFLTFAPEYKRLSYAPSLTGRDSETLEEREKYQQWLNGIAYLSCRERYGQDYIEKSIGKIAHLVVDPTLLFKKDEWKENLNLKEITGRGYILCYLFQGITPNIKKSVDKIASQKGLDVRYIPMSSTEVKCNEANDFKTAIGPKEFVELFYNASFVITNSFHGLLFSLIMNKPFYLIHRGEENEWAKHEERMTNILQLVGLENRFIYEKNLPAEFDFNIDYDTVNSKISEFREDSLHYLKEALDSVKENEKTDTAESKVYHRIDELETNSCTGCTACLNSCPKQAISMRPSDEGFLFPNIDESLCVKCGICANKCPQINSIALTYPNETLCGTGNNDYVKNSASGGAFVTFAKHVIEDLQGVVYGAALHMPEGKCEHIEADCMQNLHLLQNSKYVQSDICGVLLKCKERLEQGVNVLFSGTPCQIAALRKYLGKEYNNLVTVDIICHGVPSPKFLKNYVEHEIPKDVTTLRFRHRYEADKRRSAFDLNYEENGKMVAKPGTRDLYYAPFINAESYRECCYECQYAREERVSDITIGDCDSYRLYSGLEKNNIISSILINTEKGKHFWNECSDMFTFAEMDYKEECIFNHQLRRPSARPSRRDYIYKELQEGWDAYKNKNQKRDGLELKVKQLLLKLINK